jgi:phenylpyruvate tautomerase PptA (4-oxalocrotonate tautomerase family)
MTNITTSLACGVKSSFFKIGGSLFDSHGRQIGVIQMPFYTAITQEGTVSVETKAKIAEEITRIHTSVMKMPKNYVRVVFLSYPKGSGFTGGGQASTASLNCVLRSGHTPCLSLLMLAGTAARPSGSPTDTTLATF